MKNYRFVSLPFFLLMIVFIPNNTQTSKDESLHICINTHFIKCVLDEGRVNPPLTR
jgi:hypothetical protein